ncbi:MAG: AAA family ATPase, partial [Salinisphaera sp.]|nr:AAA family ATPase [Salinisphaera sp.]
MAQAKSVFVCEQCGATQPKWAGRCPDCGAWNSFAETVAAGKGASARGGGVQVQKLGSVAMARIPRVETGLVELDRVLGGGLVPGSVVLIGGDPGIGKSTLLLQVLAGLAGQLPVLYVSGEESLQQLRLRADRLGVDAAKLAALTETCVERVLALVRAQAPQLMVVDSVQTVYSEALNSAPGSVSQLRETAAMLVRYAKATETVLVLVGHVTKEGVIAGPRVLE